MKNLKQIVIIMLILTLPSLANASDEHETKSMKSPADVSGGKTSKDAVADKQKQVQPAPAPESAKAYLNRPLYKPPLRGSPAGRVGGGTRGTTERESFSLFVLAPDHVGLTIREQPCLYWYISKPIPYPVELSVIERNAVKPLFEKVVKGPDKGGIQSVCLANYDVHLRQSVQYKWFVTLVIDSDRRSKDILAGGIIARVEPSRSLLDKLKTVTGIDKAYILAEEGLWYDALEAISGIIGTSPKDTDLRRQRAALLEQVGLTEVTDGESGL